MKKIFAIVSFLISISVFAAEEAPKSDLGEDLKKGAEKVSNSMIEAYRTSSERALDSRKAHSATVLFSYSPLDLLLPSKTGGNFAWHGDADTLYELDYSASSVKIGIQGADLSAMKETRISLLKRNFSGGAFNWYWGVNYNAMNAHISQVLMSTTGNGVSDLVDVQTLGLSIGVGHRWVIKEKWSLGVDWFSWAQPLAILKKEAPFINETSNGEYKGDIDKVLTVAGYFPRWAAFKLYIGYSF